MFNPTELTGVPATWGGVMVVQAKLGVAAGEHNT